MAYYYASDVSSSTGYQDLHQDLISTLKVKERDAGRFNTFSNAPGVIRRQSYTKREVNSVFCPKQAIVHSLARQFLVSWMLRK
jgi:hypothetical protein